MYEETIYNSDGDDISMSGRSEYISINYIPTCIGTLLYIPTCIGILYIPNIRIFK